MMCCLVVSNDESFSITLSDSLVHSVGPAL